MQISSTYIVPMAKRGCVYAGAGTGTDGGIRKSCRIPPYFSGKSVSSDPFGGDPDIWRCHDDLHGHDARRGDPLLNGRVHGGSSHSLRSREIPSG